MRPALLRRLSCWLWITGIYCVVVPQANSQQADSILRFMPEEVPFFAAVMGEIKPDASGSSLERWLAQPEIAASFTDLIRLVEETMDVNDVQFARVARVAPKLVLGSSWVVYLESSSLESGAVKFVAKLDDLEDETLKILATIEVEAGDNIERFLIDQNQFFRGRVSNDESIEFGIHQNHLFIALGEGELETLVARQNAAPSPLIESLKQELALERLAGLMYVDLKTITRVFDFDGELSSNPFRLDEFERIVGAIGIQGDETVSTIKFDIRNDAEGLASIFNVQPISQEDLKAVSDSVNSLSAIKFDLGRLWALLNEDDSMAEDLAEFVEDTQQELGINLKTDIVDSFGELIYTYQELSMINPAASGILSIRIKNPDEFAKRLPQILENLEDADGELFFLEVEETRNGPRYQLIPFEPELAMIVPSVCLQLIDDELILGLDARAIGSHLRRASRPRNKLVDDPRVAAMLNNQWRPDLGQPIGFFYLDVTSMIEGIYTVLPILFGQFGQLMDVDFDMDMLPPLKVAVNGILPDLVAIYRTDEGIQVFEMSTLPGLTTVTPVLIGALLPAVQQVRSAARRAVSMNNIRQMILACLNWESAFEALPPAFNTDEEGQPLLSWRVHILPYIEAGDLYEQFRLDEPWDSPHNFSLIEKMPEVFKHPALDLEPGKTVYLGVAGEDALFGPPKGKRGRNQTGRHIGEIKDGTSNTLMIVEANADHAVYWTKPDDLDIGQIENIADALKGNWPGIVLVGMADGSVHAIDNDENEKLRKMATVAGGEIVNW